MRDQAGRDYVRVPATDYRKYGIPRGTGWYYCVLPIRRHVDRRTRVPALGTRVRQFRVFKVLTGFARGGMVGVVGLR